MKTYMAESERGPLIEELKKGKDDIMNMHFESRDHDELILVNRLPRKVSVLPLVESR